MEIAYLVHLNMGPKTGVFKKINQQLNSWKKLGHNGQLYVLTRDEEVQQALMGKSVTFFYEWNSWSDRLKKIDSGANRIIDDNPDIVYLRQDHFYPAHARLGKALPFILEINSDVGIELWGYSIVQWIYNRLTEKKLYRSCSGAAFVTNELAEKKKGYLRGRPLKVIANGVVLTGRLPLDTTLDSEPPTLFFLGSAGVPWSGVDKILLLAKAFPQWRFHLVGPGQLNASNIPSNVHRHGVLTEKDYAPLLKASDVAISTLALHRKKLEEACSLKTREYLSCGLPVIIGYKDTDFPEDPDFLLRIENREDNIERNLSKIRDFVLRWKGKRVPRERILRIDMFEKEKERIEFFKSVTKKN